MRKIRKGDKVIVIAGKSKGLKGTVLNIVDDVRKGLRIFVEGANLKKKHQKPNPNLQIAGGIIEKEAPVDISNIALLNPETGKADKVGFKVLEDGTKVRCFKSNGEVVTNG
ncbi:MAG: 50S ribosomal protein L24 [Francisellaceae bacterium]|jgi:large subunit ribosomal protein L24|nr:50S ribosomal protein L24 [Francisellaceae bacterium]MBT6539118.1 50S ribosomal protein L24 [Francisellaceae bacterium]